MNKKRTLQLALLTFFLPLVASAQLIVNCDPALAPGEPGACGVDAFIQTITNIIQWLQLIIIPLAILFIAVGGFMILTSAGSSDKVSKGKGMITIAITGIIIMLLSTLAIKAIFYFLDVDPTEVNVPTNVGNNVL